jgi:methionine sulfoxide reductase heme-binding subunit
MSTETLWVYGRASGFVDLVLLTLTLVLGTVARSGRRPLGLAAATVSRLHRTTALLAVLFLAVHVITLIADPFAGLGVWSWIVPVDLGLRPVGTAFGTVATQLLLLGVLSGLLRRALPARGFRLLHWLALAFFPLAVIHGIATGTEGTAWYSLVTSVACVLAVTASLIWRLSPRFEPRRPGAPRFPSLPPEPPGSGRPGPGQPHAVPAGRTAAGRTATATARAAHHDLPSSKEHA